MGGEGTSVEGQCTRTQGTRVARQKRQYGCNVILVDVLTSQQDRRVTGCIWWSHAWWTFGLFNETVETTSTSAEA